MLKRLGLSTLWLAAAGTHVLLMAGFAAGLWLRGRKQKE